MVLISAPAKNVQKTIVFGVNHRDLGTDDMMVSNGSCTTNCLAPLAKVLDDEGVGVGKCSMVACGIMWGRYANVCSPSNCTHVDEIRRN